MKFFKYLFFASTILATSCPLFYGLDYYVKITNNSEHNITSVVVIDLDEKKVILNEKDNELIAPNGNSKSFKIKIDQEDDAIACLEAEDTSEPMCSIKFTLVYEGSGYSKPPSLTWNGLKSSGWVPVSTLPICPKYFQQCNPEVKND